MSFKLLKSKKISDGFLDKKHQLCYNKNGLINRYNQIKGRMRDVRSQNL